VFPLEVMTVHILFTSSV